MSIKRWSINLETKSINDRTYVIGKILYAGEVVGDIRERNPNNNINCMKDTFDYSLSPLHESALLHDTGASYARKAIEIIVFQELLRYQEFSNHVQKLKNIGRLSNNHA